MFRSLRLVTFKSFVDTDMHLAPFTLLVGANASGKSNIREAFRFLHGVSRGYTLAEVVGEKWIEGGVRVWNGTRGGAPQIARHGASTFALHVSFDVPTPQGQRAQVVDYRLDVRAGDHGELRVVREHLRTPNEYFFDTHPNDEPRGSSSRMITARIRKRGPGAPPDDNFLSDRPVLTQISESAIATDSIKQRVRAALAVLTSMAFLDLNPDAARESSPSGLKTMGDRGENLSSVLEVICEEPGRRVQLTSWVRALTPMDAIDIEFPKDVTNRVMAQLVESSGARIPLIAASDGTVRFLAMIATLLSPNRPHFIFFEEIENGIHPNRIYLLLDLIEQSVKANASQILATSHSPQLLVHAYRTADASPSLVYRHEHAGSNVVNVRTSPTMGPLLEQSDPASLMAAGWFEDVASFLDADAEEGGRE